MPGHIKRPIILLENPTVRDNPMLSGKGWYIWNVSNTLSGNYSAIVAKLIAGNFTHAHIKVADGTLPHNIVNGHDLAKELSVALKAAGLEVGAWQYVYPYQAAAAGDYGIRRAVEIGASYFIIDAEGEMKNRPYEAAAYMGAMRAAIQAYGFMGLIWLSTYRYPRLHPEFPYSVFLDGCDAVMPQVYWEQAHNPGYQLRKSFDQWFEIAPNHPYVPTGACYAWNAWKPTAADELEFLNKCVEMGLPAVNFWSLEHGLESRMLLPYIAINVFDYGVLPPPPPPPLPDKVRVIASVLNIRKTPGGVLVGYCPLGTIFGVIGEACDSTGKVWYKVGDNSWVASWWTAPI